jgi:VWFA-related protein
MRRLSKFLPLTALVVGAAVVLAPLLAQNPQKPDEETVFRADTRLVVLHASVVDKNGRLLTALPRTAFKVFENNIEQPIKTFRREDVPVSLGLVIDNSGSMRDKRKSVEVAALAAVKASNPQDEVLVVNFNDEAYDDSEGFTQNIRRMEEALTKIDARGGTAMRDALNMTVEFIRKKGKHQKKVIFCVTDGNDTASTQITLEKLVQKAHDSEVLMYFIGILGEEDGREAKKAKRAMEALAKASGGTAVFPENIEAVEKIAVDIAHEIRNQYIITYSPTNQTLDGTFRTIKVMANGPNRPVVRTRSGYYATPDANTRNTTAASFRP